MLEQRLPRFLVRGLDADPGSKLAGALLPGCDSDQCQGREADRDEHPGQVVEHTTALSRLDVLIFNGAIISACGDTSAGSGIENRCDHV